jgi:DNA (cytosine-5)-methyltransferase 1
MKPKLLDLFCGAGGAAMGYHRAGFEVIGVDNKPQLRYPFKFQLGDALEFVEEHAREFEAIHASPPCQAHSCTRAIWGREYPDLVPDTIRMLENSGRPWIIENVQGCPLPWSITLCGTSFGLNVYRHRKFFSSHIIMGAPLCLGHTKRAVAVGRPAKPGDFMTIAGHFSSLDVAKQAMGITWMTRDELAQSIPPSYTEWIGKQLLAIL